jgi:hypothetical protein
LPKLMKSQRRNSDTFALSTYHLVSFSETCLGGDLGQHHFNAQHFLLLQLQKEIGPNLIRQPRNNSSALVIFRLLLCLLSGAIVPRILKTNLRRVLRRYMQLRFGSPVILRRPVVAGHRVSQLTRPLVHSLRCDVLSAYILRGWLCDSL